MPATSNPVRHRVLIMLAMVAIAGAFALQVVGPRAANVGASPQDGPKTPTGQAAVGATLTVTPNDGLTNGQLIDWSVNTTGTATITGIQVHLCKSSQPGATSGAPPF